MKLSLTKDDAGWWVAGAPPYYADGEGPFDSYGPYSTKAEAADARSAVMRFFQDNPEVTNDRPDSI